MLEAVYQAMIDTNFFAVILTALLAVITGMITVLGKTVENYFRKMSENKDLDNAGKYVETLDKIIVETVDCLNGTIKARLLEAAADGRITEEEAGNLLELAVVEVKKNTSATVQQGVCLIIGDLDNYIKTKIEAVLTVQKANQVQALDNVKAPEVTGGSALEFEEV